MIFSAPLKLISFTHPSIALDAMGRANVVGFAWQITPTGNAALPYYCPGLIPEFLTVFSPDGRIEYSSYLSTADGTSEIPALAIGNPGQVYTTDETVLTKTDLDAPQGAVVACAVNAASFSVGRGAPGEMISLFGANLGPPEPVGVQLDLNGKVATALGGTRVLINGVPAPLAIRE